MWAAVRVVQLFQPGPRIIVYYKKIKAVNRDEHVLIMENYLGRSLDEDEVVHHIDKNKQNNNLSNLELCLKSVHTKYHYQKGDYFNIAKWNKDNSKGYRHGTYSCWRRMKCRCSECVQAQREYKKEYRRRTGIH